MKFQPVHAEDNVEVRNISDVAEYTASMTFVCDRDLSSVCNASSFCAIGELKLNRAL